MYGIAGASWSPRGTGLNGYVLIYGGGKVNNMIVRWEVNMVVRWIGKSFTVTCTVTGERGKDWVCP